MGTKYTSSAIKEYLKYEESALQISLDCALVGRKSSPISGNRHLDKAIETYRQALEVEPDSPLCRYYLVNLLQKTGDVESARGMAEEIKSLDPNADASGLARSTWLDTDRRSEFEQNLARFGLI